MKISVLLFLFFIVTAGLSGQEQKGNVQIIQDPRVDSLVNKHIELNEKNPHIEGWRINIFFESGNYSKRLALETKSQFVQKYANVPCYVVFQEPYYKVRVGDYRTKMEAEKFLKEIITEYSNAFVVEDNINFPELYPAN
jgi:hypothetical protein